MFGAVNICSISQLPMVATEVAILFELLIKPCRWRTASQNYIYHLRHVLAKTRKVGLFSLKTAFIMLHDDCFQEQVLTFTIMTAKVCNLN